MPTLASACSGSAARVVALMCILVAVGVAAAGPARGAVTPTGGGTGARVGQHWDTYLGVDVCGEWLANPPGFEQPAGASAHANNAGLHSHGDGLIHVHPFVASEAGRHATVGKFFRYGGWELSTNSIELWSGPRSEPSKTAWSNGDPCLGGQYQDQPVHLAWVVDGHIGHGNPADYHPQRGETIAIYLLPRGANLPFPPDACHAIRHPSGDYYPAGGLSRRSPCHTSRPV